MVVTTLGVLSLLAASASLNLVGFSRNGAAWMGGAEPDGGHRSELPNHTGNAAGD